MSMDPLLKLFNKNYREALNTGAYSETSVEKQLIENGLKCTLEDLMSFNIDFSEVCTVYLESLKLITAKKDPYRLIYTNQLIYAHKTLNEKRPAHREAFDSALVDLISTSCSNLQDLKELENIKIVIIYMNNKRISTLSIQHALVNIYTSLLFEKIDEISYKYNSIDALMEKLINLFDYIKDGVEIGLNTEIVKDQAASLTINFIKNELSEMPRTSGDMSRVLLFEIQKIYPLSQDNLQIIENLIQSLTQQEPQPSFSPPFNASSALPPPNPLPLQSQVENPRRENPEAARIEFPEYYEIETIYSRLLSNFTVEIKHIKLLPNNQKATLKKYSPGNSSNIEEWKNEIEILQTLSEAAQDDNCLIKYYHSRLSSDLYIIMEFCEADLQKIIESRKSLNKLFSDKEKGYLISTLLKGFAIMHEKNIFHRDIKPANILINTINGVLVPKIADFGCSVICKNDQTLTTTIKIFGTKDFLPPECLDAEGQHIQNYNGMNYLSIKKADVYSLGLTFLYIVDFKQITGYNNPNYFCELEHRIRQIEPFWIRIMLNQMLCTDPMKREDLSNLRKFLPEEKTIEI